MTDPCANVSLPMYDLEEIREHTQGLWAVVAGELARRGVHNVPDRLQHPDDLEGHWRSDRLLLSQTCGYPLIRTLRGAVKVVATPSFAIPGCRPGYYFSQLLVREDSGVESLKSLRGGVCAVNSPHSHSGHNVLRAMLALLAGGRAFFSRVVTSGTHEASVALVACGDADVCAIDCVSHALLEKHRPEGLAGTRVLCRSPEAPGLPYITARSTPTSVLERMRDALAEAFADPATADARKHLLIDGLEWLTETDYNAVEAFERSAVSQGYPELR